MKTILALAFAVVASSAFAAEPVAVPYPQATETPSGCVWTNGRGSCVVSNTTLKEMTCDVTTKVAASQTMGGWARVTNHVTRTKITIQPKMTDNVKITAPDGQKITDAQIVAVCK